MPRIARRLARAFLLLAALGLLGCAHDPQRPPSVTIKKVELVWAGVYEGRLDGFTPPRRMVRSETVPARIGQRFGLLFTLETEPAGGLMAFDYRVTVPEPGLPDRNGQRQRVSQVRIQCFLARPCPASFVLEQDSELLLGTWVLEIAFRGQTLITQRFTLVAPQAGSSPPMPNSGPTIGI